MFGRHRRVPVAVLGCAPLIVSALLASPAAGATPTPAATLAGAQLADPVTAGRVAADPAELPPDDVSLRQDPALLAEAVDPGDRATVAVAEVDDGRLIIRDIPVRGPDQAEAVIAGVQNDPSALSVGIATRVTALAEPGLPVAQPVLSADPRRSEQWGLDTLGAESAWRVATGGGQVIAVIDSGVKPDHPDLLGHVSPGIDPLGHGTHVAGIIAATAGNGVGVAGLAPEATILPVRVLDSTGSGASSDVARGIIWAADHGATVINLSLGSDVDRADNPADPTMRTAVQYAVGKGIPVAAAAGNERLDGNAASYPAAYPEVVAVAATDRRGSPGWFSTTGGYVDVAAPGVDILSTVPTGYQSQEGTSMATPFVAATLALLRERHPEDSPAQLQARLESTATDVATPGRDPETGVGLINPDRALGSPVTDLSAAPAITGQPRSISVPLGAPFVLAVAARGVTDVHWERLTAAGWKPVAGVSTLRWAVPRAARGHTGWYRAVVANGNGVRATSRAALFVLTAPTVVRHPVGVAAREPSAVALVSTASGVPAVSQRWQVSINNGATWQWISGAQGARLSVVPRYRPALYRAVFSNSQGQAISRAAKVLRTG
jgi:type VII secretion-associated serine protease mycosin